MNWSNGMQWSTFENRKKVANHSTLTLIPFQTYQFCIHCCLSILVCLSQVISSSCPSRPPSWRHSSPSSTSPSTAAHSSAPSSPPSSERYRLYTHSGIFQSGPIFKLKFNMWHQNSLKIYNFQVFMRCNNGGPVVFLDTISYFKKCIFFYF